MITYPVSWRVGIIDQGLIKFQSTHGVFESNILDVSQKVHECGG